MWVKTLDTPSVRDVEKLFALDADENKTVLSTVVLPPISPLIVIADAFTLACVAICNTNRSENEARATASRIKVS